MIPKGATVKYIGSARWANGHEVIGTVLEYHDGWNEIMPNGKRSVVKDWVVVSVHSVPKLWPYLGTSKFAPSASDVEIVDIRWPESTSSTEG